MKYAFFPGCVAKGGAPELYDSAKIVMERLNIETVELKRASCTGAGVLQEKDKKMGDILNIRTLAMAEDIGLSLLVICSTCQGVISQANHRVRSDSKYLDEINDVLSDEGLKYNGTTKVKHLLWAIIEDIGIEDLKKTFVSELKGLELAPFYGCYMVRPSDALEFNKYPERENSLELLIESTGASVTKYSGTTACCGFPILFINQENSLKMVSNHTGSAKDSGANAIVTPCPLCHLNLDGYQPKARKNNRKDKADMPIIHVPQLIGLAMGISKKELGLQKHIVSTKEVLKKIEEITL